jgi:hypothetical protein
LSVTWGRQCTLISSINKIDYHDQSKLKLDLRTCSLFSISCFVVAVHHDITEILLLSGIKHSYLIIPVTEMSNKDIKSMFGIVDHEFKFSFHNYLDFVWYIYISIYSQGKTTNWDQTHIFKIRTITQKLWLPVVNYTYMYI